MLQSAVPVELGMGSVMGGEGGGVEQHTVLLVLTGAKQACSDRENMEVFLP